MTRVILHGCLGRMGQAIARLSKENDEIKIVAGIDSRIKECDEQFEFPVFESINECNVLADVIIDFSVAKAVPGLIQYAVAAHLPIVLCTTGLSEQDLTLVQDATNAIAILRSANMSVGVNLLIQLVEEAAAKLKEQGFDIEIVEKHHRHKLDAPSGTAIALADAAVKGADRKYTYTFDRSQERRERTDNEIGFASVRGGSITGEHDVIFAGTDEVLTLSHEAYSRDIFAKGAISAAIFLKDKPQGMYSMKDVLSK